MDETNFVNLGHARSDDQRALMEQIQQDGVCPFCYEHLRDYHPKPILREQGWWLVTENMTPYEGTRVHLLVIYRLHTTLPTEVEPEALIELFHDVMPWTMELYGMTGGTILWRFGDTELTGGSVDHLHLHLIVGASKQEGGEPIRVKIGYQQP